MCPQNMQEDSEEFGEFQSARPNVADLLLSEAQRNFAAAPDEIKQAYDMDGFAQRVKMASEYLGHESPALSNDARVQMQRLIAEAQHNAHEILRIQQAQEVISRDKSKPSESVVDKVRIVSEHYLVPRTLENHFVAVEKNSQKEAEKTILQHENIDKTFKEMQQSLLGISDIPEVSSTELLREDIQKILECYREATDQAPQLFVDDLYQQIEKQEKALQDQKKDPKEFRKRMDAAFYDSKQESKKFLSSINGVYAAEIAAKITQLSSEITVLEASAPPELQEKYETNKILEAQFKNIIDETNAHKSEITSREGGERKFAEKIQAAERELKNIEAVLGTEEMQNCQKLERAKLIKAKAEDMAAYIKQSSTEKLDTQVFVYNEQYAQITDADLTKNSFFYKIAEKASTVSTYVAKLCHPSALIASKVAAHSHVTHGLHVAGAAGMSGMTYAWGAMALSGAQHVVFGKSTAEALEREALATEPLLRAEERTPEIDYLREGFENTKLEKLTVQELADLRVKEKLLDVKMGYEGRVGNMLIGTGTKKLFGHLKEGASWIGKKVSKHTPEPIKKAVKKEAAAVSAVVSAKTKAMLDPIKESVGQVETSVFKTPILQEKLKVAEKLYGKDYMDHQTKKPFADKVEAKRSEAEGVEQRGVGG